MNSLGIKKNEYDDFAVGCLIVGAIETKCCFVENKKTGEALIIDPGDEAERIAQYIQEKGLSPQAVLLTHGHFDHVLAMPALREKYQIPVYCYEKEAALLADPGMNGSARWPELVEPVRFTADRLMKDGDRLELAGFSFLVLHTPGHTAGSCCFYFPDYHTLFSGDTLFHGSYGRTDLATGSDAQILASVRMLLQMLPEETTVYPGHGSRTFIAFEKRFNPLAGLL